jgi:hypothetical protein
LLFDRTRLDQTIAENISNAGPGGMQAGVILDEGGLNAVR